MREKLFKIGALVRVRVRRVVVALSEAYPWREVFAQVWANLRQLVVPGPAAARSG